MANVLRAYRVKNDLSQAEVAVMLDVSRAMVCALENGARNFTAEMALKIESKLGIDRMMVRPDLFRRKAA